MSCVPYEQHTFEFGPRDYLNQLMSLISNLRGGQERYLPLLISKINDTMPAMPTPGYALPAPISGASSRVAEIFDEHSVHTKSSDSTPFGSPPMSAVSGDFSFNNLDAGRTTAPPMFPITMTTGIQFGDLTVSAPMQPPFHVSEQSAQQRG